MSNKTPTPVLPDTLPTAADIVGPAPDCAVTRTEAALARLTAEHEAVNDHTAVLDNELHTLPNQIADALLDGKPIDKLTARVADIDADKRRNDDVARTLSRTYTLMSNQLTHAQHTDPVYAAWNERRTQIAADLRDVERSIPTGPSPHRLTEQQLTEIYQQLDSRSPIPPEVRDMLQDQLEAHRNAPTPTDPDTIAAVRSSLVLGVAHRWGWTPTA